ncbi:MAG: hypothetical protein HN368_11825 [Spirochaetales bacterium]|nr:hypothetical protein [Spirochaetales bacterium]
MTASASHEWWALDGFICFDDYEKGAHECNPVTPKATNVWQRPLCHAHCNGNGHFGVLTKAHANGKKNLWNCFFITGIQVR